MLSDGECSGNTRKRYAHQLAIEPAVTGTKLGHVRRDESVRTRAKACVQDEILIMLSDVSLHGYGIWNIILERYPDMRLNTLYRWMNDLESQGLIEARIKQGVRGPDRKVYTLTNEGQKRIKQLTRDAIRLMVDVYRRYRLFSAQYFNNIQRAAAWSNSKGRVLIAPFQRFLDIESSLIRSLVDDMVGRPIDFVGHIPGIPNRKPRPRILKGCIRDLPVRNEIYDEVWLWGMPKRGGFIPSVDECRRVLVKGGILCLAIPFLTTSDYVSPGFATFITNSIAQVFPELELMELNEVESILSGSFEDTGILEFGIHVIWARK